MKLPRYQYRVTKYDPKLRSATGAYLADDWTSCFDIGKSFGGTLLTEKRYLGVEQAYLQAAVAFLAEANIVKLKVVGLENHQQILSAPPEGSTIQSSEASQVLRSLLREEYWCKLENPKSFIHVGYDYYMYIGLPTKCPNAIAVANSIGLFVEEFPSPYAAR